jgi:magnesium transporter
MSTSATPADTIPADAVQSGIINCAAYENGHRVQDLPLSGLAAFLDSHPNAFVWVGLFEPAAEVLQTVQHEFRLHELAIEDAYRAHQRPKLEQYGDMLFAVLRTAHTEDDAVAFGETHIFVGPRFVVSVRHGSLQSHVDLRTRCEATPHLLAKGSGYVLYALMDFVVDQYFPIVDALEQQLEDIEEQTFGGGFGRHTTARIYQLKRNLLGIKRAVSPLIDVSNRLIRYDSPLIPEDTRLYFRDVYDHVIRINEMVDTTRELLTTALEANLSLISVAQNEHMKRLAAWAAIIAVPTMIAGVYGMNFSRMPELHWAYGYPASIVLMLVVCSFLYAGFRRSGWL